MARSFAEFELGVAINPDVILVGSSIDGIDGTVVLPAEDKVEEGTKYGPNNSRTGTANPIGIGDTASSHTVTDVDGNALSNVEVWASTDISGSIAVAGTLLTDSSGGFTFMLDAGTYYLWQNKPGINFTNPTEFTVA